MKSIAPQPRRKTGRPLSFDRDAVLHQAMLTFWRFGYEGTSIVDLTTAMGLSAPSLYAAFGDKQQLFLEAMRLYAGDPDAMKHSIDSAPTAASAARNILTAAARTYTGTSTPRGCLLASATASGSLASSEVQHAVTEVRRGIAACLRARIRRDISAGLLPPTTMPDALVGLVMAVTQGMSVLARDGATRASLLSTVELTMNAWPPPQTSTRAVAKSRAGKLHARNGLR